jgi:hypothetical protein
MGDNYNLTISTRNLADDSDNANLTSPISSGSYPVSNLAKRRLADKWRSTGVAGRTVWVSCDVPVDDANEVVGLVALVDTNLSPSATWNVAVTEYESVTNCGGFDTAYAYEDYATTGTAVVSGGVLTLTGFVGTFRPNTTETLTKNNATPDELADMPHGYVIDVSVNSISGGGFRIALESSAGVISAQSLAISTAGRHVFYHPHETADSLSDLAYRWNILVGTGNDCTAELDNLKIYPVIGGNRPVANTATMAGAACFPALATETLPGYGQWRWSPSWAQGDYGNLKRNAVWVVPPTYLKPGARKVWVMLSDASNSDGYIQAGRLIISGYWMAEFNATNLAMHMVDPSVHAESYGGQMYTHRRTKKKRVTFDCQAMGSGEAFGLMHRLQQIQGVHADMVVAVDSGDDEMHHIFTVYGRHGAVGTLKNWAPDRWSTQFEIVELN